MVEILSEMFADAVLFLWRMLLYAVAALILFLVFQTLGFIGLGAVLFTWWWWWDSWLNDELQPTTYNQQPTFTGSREGDVRNLVR